VSRTIVGLGLFFCLSVAFAEVAATSNQLGDLPPDLQVKIAQVLGKAIQDGGSLTHRYKPH